ncbi:MAG TPA: copper transporter [Bacillota bacterium]|nr:copper transporter [Bacillota bacterium]
MFDYREYFIAIAAIFLALALGILVGVSFGDNFVVSNQRKIIELLEQELERRKGIINEKNEALERWEQLKPLLKRSYLNRLNGKVIIVIAREDGKAAELQVLLESSGAMVQLWTAEAVLAPAAGETGASPDFEAWPPPDCFIVLMEGTPDPVGVQVSEQLLLREDKQVIAAYPWTGREDYYWSCSDERCGVIDNIDTFWGQIALLEMIASGTGGYYGFSSRGQGLIPLWEEAQ